MIGPERTYSGPERTYSSKELVRFLGVTPRQLQCWDEMKIVSPRREGHRRIYGQAEAELVGIVARLRAKRAANVSRLVRRLTARRHRAHLEGKEFPPLGDELWLALAHPRRNGTELKYFIVDSPERLLRLVSLSTGGMHVVSIGDVRERLRQKRPHRAKDSSR